jgi:hypothetical protein
LRDAVHPQVWPCKDSIISVLYCEELQRNELEFLGRS